MPPGIRTADDWSRRWAPLARAAGIEPEERLCLALSGGADSVLLLHWLAAADPPVNVRAAHVDHGLRGPESEADARFAADLCRALGVPLAILRAELDPRAPSLEARARAERYRLLVAEARRTGHTTLLTGHHSDDALETLLLRWFRGTELAGLRGPRPALRWRERPGEEAVRVVRPLLTLRREEVRSLLARRGLTWREDGSNADPRFARNRVRHVFLPLFSELGGPGALEELRDFGRAVEALESELAQATAHLAWQPSPFAPASRGPARRALGGVLERAALMRLARPLARRVLWRLLTEGTGTAPARAVLERVLQDLAGGRCTRHSLSRRWTLVLRAREILLLPPGPRRVERAEPRQLLLPFPGAEPAQLQRRALPLSVPGIVTLEDGRRISAELVDSAPGEPVARSALEAELDARDLTLELGVRWPAPGDRFRALGAPGSKPLARFLADRGVPREERARVPVVCARGEILWVAGIGPGERHRVQPATRRRLRLALHG